MPEDTAESQPAGTDESAAEDVRDRVPAGAEVSPAAPLLMGVKLPIRVLLGRTQLSLRAVTQLTAGAVVELDCSPNDPVQILVHDRVIAYGEVVVVAGNYGVRITEIPTRENSAPPSVDSALRTLSENLR